MTDRKAALEALQRFDSYPYTDVGQVAADIATIRAALTEMYADAERYRWLREHRYHNVGGNTSLWRHLELNDLRAGGLDAAIDAARQEAKP